MPHFGLSTLAQKVTSLTYQYSGQFLKGFTRLSELMFQRLGIFFKVSPAFNLGKKILPMTESEFEP
jgi:hypothetical protein